MTHRVTIRQFGQAIPVAEGETILAAALARGLPYPCGCHSGNCGTCKSRLLSGEIALEAHSEFALTDAERAAGLILACRALPRSDCEVAYLEMEPVVAHPIRRLACRVAAVAPATRDITRVRLSIGRGGPFAFTAGQYAAVAFPGLPPRDYSMASQPDEAELEFHVRAVDGGVVSRFIHQALRPGMGVAVEGPFGTSYLRERHAGPILALAGGSGLAPVKCIVERALALGIRQDIHLYFGARDERDLYLEDHFAGLARRHPNLRFVPVLSEPTAPTRRRTGTLGDAVAADFSLLDGAKAYLTGPPAMVETCIEVLARLGVRPQDRHADAFYTEADKARLGRRA